MEEIKQEFEDEFTGGKKYAGSLDLEDLWAWIASKINEAKGEGYSEGCADTRKFFEDGLIKFVTELKQNLQG